MQMLASRFTYVHAAHVLRSTTHMLFYIYDVKRPANLVLINVGEICDIFDFLRQISIRCMVIWTQSTHGRAFILKLALLWKKEKKHAQFWFGCSSPLKICCEYFKQMNQNFFSLCRGANSFQFVRIKFDCKCYNCIDFMRLYQEYLKMACMLHLGRA